MIAEFTAEELAWSAARNQLSQMPRAMSRPEYEDACATMGVKAMPDTECNGYGVHYGQFAPPEYPVAHCVTMAMAARRLAGMKVERAARPGSERAPVETVRCNCGHSVPRNLVMSANCGTSCPDCYDRMST